MLRQLGSLFLALAAAAAVTAGEAPVRRGNQLLDGYFGAETARLERESLAGIRTAEDWSRSAPEFRRQLAEMLGLDPMPPRTDLKPVITGTVEHSDFVVERLHFQSRPGLYVTGNLYLPRRRDKPAPAVLYVCGHGNVKKDGVSYGSKTFYQHHGAWFARHGYVCLVIDTLQLGEIEGFHHGTHPNGRSGFWWWNSRGYTPGGVEAWNGIRALDYLQSRPEVDPEKLGITGRSGGGAYSWFVAALDERVKAAVPVAGITDLHNHVVDGVVEGHCDCMFVVNTYRWDYAQLAALVAPRPLLLSNTDKDPIFPLDGVYRLYRKVESVYRLLGARDRLGLLVTEGPHADTQDLQVPALRWFDRFLKGEQPLISVPAEKLLQPEQLMVFAELPADQKNTTAHEWFTERAAPTVPSGPDDWRQTRERLMAALRRKSFGGWPAEDVPLRVEPGTDTVREGVRFRSWDIESQPGVTLRLWLLQRAGEAPPELVVLNVLDGTGWREFAASARAGFPTEMAPGPGEPELPAPNPEGMADLRQMFARFHWGMAYLAPREVGPTTPEGTPAKRVHHRRRYQLLGQTRAGMQVWDARRGLQALRKTLGSGVPLWLQGQREMSVVALYSALFEPGVARLDLWGLPLTHQAAASADGEGNPDLLNVLRFMDVPHAVALAAERCPVKLYQARDEGWDYPREVGRRLGWDPKRVEVRVVPARGG